MAAVLTLVQVFTSPLRGGFGFAAVGMALAIVVTRRHGVVWGSIASSATITVGVLLGFTSIATFSAAAVPSMIVGMASVMLAMAATVTEATRAVRVAERKLAQIPQEAQPFLESSNSALIEFDFTGAVLSINPAAERLLGWSAADALGQRIDIMPTNHVSTRDFVFAEVQAGHPVGSVECEWKASDGALHDVLVAAAPRFGSDGQPVSVLISAQDVTALKAVQRERDDLRELLATTIESATNGIILRDGHSQLLVANSAARHMLGLTSEHLAGREPLPGWWGVVDETGGVVGSSDFPVNQAAKALVPTPTVTHGILGPDASITWTRTTATPIVDNATGTLKGTVTSISDITELKQREHELQQALSRLGSLVANAPVAIYAIEAESRRISLWNPAAEHLFGGTAAQRIGTPLVMRDEADQNLPSGLRAVLGGSPILGMETTRHRQDGSKVDVSLSVVPLTADDGGRKELLFFAEDISDRKAAHARMQQALGRLNTLVEHAPLAIWASVEPTRKVTVWNPAAERVFGWARDEVLGLPLPMVPADGKTAATKARDAAIAGTPVVAMEADVMTKHHGLTPVNLSLVSVPRLPDAAGGEPEYTAEVLGFGFDITERRAMERELEASRLRYQRLVEGATDIVYETDSEGYFTFWNDPAEALTGFSSNELQGMRFTQLVTPEWRTRTVHFYTRQAVEHIPTSYYEFPLLTKTGNPIWVGQHVQLLEEDGKAVGFTAILRNIDDRRRAEDEVQRQFTATQEALARLAALLDAVDDGILLIGPDGAVLSRNRALGDLLPAASLGPTPMVSDWLAAVEPMLESNEALRTVFAEARRAPEAFPGALLHQYWPVERDLRITSAPVQPAGGAAGAVLIAISDVSEAIAGNRAKDEMLALVGHELKTPLTAILGYADLLLTDTAGPLDDVVRDYLTTINDAANGALTILNDLMDLSQLEAGRVSLRLRSIDIADAIRRSAQALSPMLTAKAHQLDYDLPAGLPPVQGDGTRVVQVLQNLLTNAIKYTPAGGHIWVRAKAEGARVRVEVEDNGVGMNAAQQARVFSRFFRAKHPATRREPGTGLGLAITRSLVELQHGTIDFTSEAEHGSCFAITLPVWQPTAEGAEPAQRHILVVEDDARIGFIMSRFLERDNYRVTVAATGAEALKQVATSRFDAITLDLGLPDMHGLAVLQHLKDTPATTGIPVLIISAQSDDGRAKRLGAAGFLNKPMRQQDLQQAIAALW